MVGAHGDGDWPPWPKQEMLAWVPDVSWRATAEQLKRERFMFSIRADLYEGLSTEQALPLLAKRVVGIETTESQEWRSKQLSEGDASGSPTRK
jgi:hypothetical protein